MIEQVPLSLFSPNEANFFYSKRPILDIGKSGVTHQWVDAHGSIIEGFVNLCI